MSDRIPDQPKLVPGDRVRRTSTGQAGFVASDELAGRVVVRIADGPSEEWPVDDIEKLARAFWRWRAW